MPDSPFHPALIFVVFIAIFIVVAILGHLAKQRRRKELAAWCGAHNLQFDPGKTSDITNRYPFFDCLDRGKNRYAYNRMTGTWRGRPMEAFDYHYATESRDSKGRTRTSHHHFSAVIFTCDVPLHPLLIRPERFFDKVTAFFGHDDIDFESAEFSRRFYVQSPNRRWAYDVIHTRTMEFLLSHPQFTLQFGGVHAIAYRSSTFRPEQFEAAAGVLAGVLDGFPEYLVRQLQGQT